ncbi:MAG: MnhB domain-containing protein [Candidatus Rokuibacteriota bacterium]
MIERHASVIVQTFVRVMTPLLQLFAFYVLAHGHYSPGGGFQGGVILGATYILVALSLGHEALDRRVEERACLALACLGALLYLGVGVAPMLAGAAFLDYAALPLAPSSAGARYVGILLVEVGVMLTVTAALVGIFCRLGAQPAVR